MQPSLRTTVLAGPTLLCLLLLEAPRNLSRFSCSTFCKLPCHRRVCLHSPPPFLVDCKEFQLQRLMVSVHPQAQQESRGRSPPFEIPISLTCYPQVMGAWGGATWGPRGRASQKTGSSLSLIPEVGLDLLAVGVCGPLRSPLLDTQCTGDYLSISLFPTRLNPRRVGDWSVFCVPTAQLVARPGTQLTLV